MNIHVNDLDAGPSVRELERALHLEKIRADHMDLFGEEPPARLLQPYPLNPEGQRRQRRMQKKYTEREKNIRRCWNRIQLFLPELLLEDRPAQDVLEMSTAHGGMLEILRHYGHRVTGNDFANMMKASGGRDSSFCREVNDDGFDRIRDDDGNRLGGSTGAPDWPYRHIIEALDLPMQIFDGGITPYPLADNSFDTVICIQAIEHYCRPSGWAAVLDEFCRIARKTIVVVPNPINVRLQNTPGYREEFDAAMLDLRKFNRNGFACTSCHVHWNGPHGFKLTAL